MQYMVCKEKAAYIFLVFQVHQLCDSGLVPLHPAEYLTRNNFLGLFIYDCDEGAEISILCHSNA